MNLAITNQDILLALLIFLLRVSDMTLDTLRLLLVVRGRRRPAWGLGFLEALFFLAAIALTLTHLSHPLEILAFAAGYATGVVVGMHIEDRLAIGHIHFTIISPRRGAQLSERLRTEGFAVTELAGRGQEGTVSLLHCDVRRHQRNTVETIVLETDPQAFVTINEVRPLRRGFWRG